MPPISPIAGKQLQRRVEPGEAGWRLDHFLTAHFPDYSRTFLLKGLGEGILVNGQPAGKAGQRLHAGDEILFCVPAPENAVLQPEPVNFDVLFEDEHLVLLNKPPGLVVHPGNGHHSGTLAHGLLYRYHDLPATDEGRAGLVHRLDKDTSGALLAAKTEKCLQALMAAFQERRVEKVYHAILLQTPPEMTGRMVAPLGRHPVQRQKMTICERGGRYAATTWRIQESYANGWCLAELGLETGRTHQIRVHMSALHMPVAGDELYGGKVREGNPVVPPRQMLHASRLRFVHPVTGETIARTAPFWPDMEEVLARLRALSQEKWP